MTNPVTSANAVDALLDNGHGALAGTVAAVSLGVRRDALLTVEQVVAYRKYVVSGTTGTRLWTDPKVGTYVILDA